MRAYQKAWSALFFLLAGGPELSAQEPKRVFIPPPLRVYVSFQSTWNGVLETLKERNLEITRQDQSQGYIATRYWEYTSGPLTENHIAKIGHKPKLPDGEWVRVEYQLEILVELIQVRETLLTVNANIRALKREFLGPEVWVNVPTNGRLEEDFLTDFGKLIFGESFTLRTARKGFWQREPSYLPEMEERIPKIVGPERPIP